jgi:predicted peptidase
MQLTLKLRTARRVGGATLVLVSSLAVACTSIERAPRAKSGPAAPRLVRHAYESTATSLERDYYVYLPRGYDSDGERRWPALLFLHGHGERGDGKEELGWVMKQGPLYEAWIQRRDLQFVIVAPQLPMFDMKTSAPYLEFRDQAEMPAALDAGVPPRPAEFPTTEPMTGAVPDPELPFGIEGPPSGWDRCEDDLLGILDSVLATYGVDPDRLYLTGLSYGGFGTWYLASRHPERFAAIAPVVGWGHPDLMAPLADPPMPVWVFAGGRDPAVLTKHFFPGLNALEQLGHPDVRFTVHEDMNHDVWERVYGGRDLYDWLLEQRRTRARTGFGDESVPE